MITGSVFALIVIAHVLRLVADGFHLLRDPAWVVLTLAAGALAAWAFRLLWIRAVK
jgi:hypothetical protein